jgi:3D (Asp-Asp-Asp) domain-containing protein
MMKRLTIIFLLGTVGAAHGYYRNDSLLARVTVYWAKGGRGSDHYSRQHKSATGQRLQQGHCAVDPKKIPYGSRVVLPDGSALKAVDTGMAVRNRKAARYAGRTPSERNAIVIDKFFETRQQALAWASSNPPFVNVKVIPPTASEVATPNITNSQRIALAPAQTTSKATTSAGGSVAAMTITSNPSTSGPTGGIIRNPLGRLGR